MRILKLDVGRLLGIAVVDSGWRDDTKKIIFLKEEICWKKTIPQQAKVNYVYNLIINYIKQFKPDEVWIEQLNHFRNAIAVRSLIGQQSSIHLAAIHCNINSIEINCNLSFRKKRAMEKIESLNLKTEEEITENIADALCIGEGKEW